MKILNKGEPQQITFNHSAGTDFKGFININKKCTAKPYFFLVTAITLTTDNPLCFRKNLLERI